MANQGYMATIYDDKGNRRQGKVINGQTYLADGTRLPTGWTVETKGGYYTMGADGKGVKTTAPNLSGTTGTSKPGYYGVEVNDGGATPTMNTGGGYSGPDIYSIMEAQRQAQREAINQALSPDTYNKIFSQIMEQLMPLYDTQKAEIGDAAMQQRRLADVDAERRGLYTSGVGAVMQNEVAKAEQRALAQALAALQAQATELTGRQQDRLLQGIGMQGGWTSADTASLINLLDSDRSYELGLSKLDLERLLGTGRLDLDRDLGYGKLDLERLNSDRDYELGLGNLGLNEKRLAEEQRQFDASLAEKQRQYNMDYDFRERSFTESVRQWEGEMGLKWEQLHSSNKIAWMNAEIARADQAMRREQWTDQKAYNQAMMKRQGLEDARGAYEYVTKLRNAGASKNDALTAIEMYKGFDSGLYSDLKATVNNMWGTSSTGSSGGKTGILNQPFQSKYGLGQYSNVLRKR